MKPKIIYSALFVLCVGLISSAKQANNNPTEGVCFKKTSKQSCVQEKQNVKQEANRDFDLLPIRLLLHI